MYTVFFKDYRENIYVTKNIQHTLTTCFLVTTWPLFQIRLLFSELFSIITLQIGQQPSIYLPPAIYMRSKE